MCLTCVRVDSEGSSETRFEESSQYLPEDVSSCYHNDGRDTIDIIPIRPGGLEENQVSQ